MAKPFLLALSLALILTTAALADEPDLATGVPTRLVIPAIALDSEITPVGLERVEIDGQTYGRWQVADNLIGWHNLSARVGQVGNTVLAGHSDIKAKVFRNLKEVEVGDEIIVFAGEQAYPYTITQKFLVQEKGVPLEQRRENARWIAPTPDERLTLVTCANPGATHRLIIIAHPVSP